MATPKHNPPAGSGTNRLSADDFARGYTLCDCGDYAYVFRADVLQQFPAGYHDEMCAVWYLPSHGDSTP